MRACFAHARFLISPNLEVYGKIAWSVPYVENGSRTNIFDGITIPHTLFASAMEQEFQTPCCGSDMMAGSSCATIANAKVMLLFGRLLTQSYGGRVAGSAIATEWARGWIFGRLLTRMSQRPGTDAIPTASSQTAMNWGKKKSTHAQKNESRLLGWQRCAHTLLHAAFGSSAGISECRVSVNVEEMARIFDVFRDVALLQMLCHLLLGDTQGMALALPIDDAFISQPRLPGVRTVLHLLASCQQLMRPHQNVMQKWRKQCEPRNASDDEVIVDDIISSVASSSPEPSDDGAFWARSSPDDYNPYDLELDEAWSNPYDWAGWSRMIATDLRKPAESSAK